MAIPAIGYRIFDGAGGNAKFGESEVKLDSINEPAINAEMHAAHESEKMKVNKPRRPMSPRISIRSETDADVGAINEVTIAAFKTLEISNQTEQFIIKALRAASALTISLVAELNGRIVGHIAFSPVTISDGTRNWYGLGPVSVLPEYQRQGIGKALIQEGLLRLKGMNAKGCCLVGHPDYNRQFGFNNVPGLVVDGVPEEAFFALPFDRHTPRGSVTFHEAFTATS